MIKSSTTVTDHRCFDRRYRYHLVIENDPGSYTIKVYELPNRDDPSQFGGRVINQECPAHTEQEAQRAATVFWMDRLGPYFSDTRLAKERLLTE